METIKHFDGEALATRQDIMDAFSRIMETDIDSAELSRILRAMTGWNETTCKRYATGALAFDDRRRSILIEQVEAHIGDLEDFKAWLKTL